MSSDKIVGIDLGTTHSAIAHLDDHGRPEILANAESERITPSVILFDEGGEVVVGRIAKAQAVADPARVVQFIKREMGNPGFRQELAGREWTPEELSALILKKLVADAGARLGAPPRRAVITVPAHFNDAQRKATQDAGRIAGLEVARILDEPTAAALAYGTHHKDRPGTYLVFDLGGGTLDATLMDIGPDGFAVRGTQGDDRLGGKDWDDRIVTHVAARFKEEHGADPLEDPRSYQDLLDKAEAAKIALSHKTRVRIACHHAGRSTQVELTREEFEELTADLLGRCEIKAKCVLEDAGLESDRLAGVLLSGGSTRMPQVPRMLAATFGLEPETAVNPDEAVALGAALQGALVEIAERRARGEDPGPLGAALGEIAVATVNAHSLGVVARRNGGFENVILIPRNTPLPCERTGFFATLYDNQQFVEINVLEGEAAEPESCVKIGRCRITGLPPRRRGAPVVVTYRYDADGRVHVLAKDQETGHEAQAVIEHDHGLAEAAVLEAKERLSAVAVT